MRALVSSFALVAVLATLQTATDASEVADSQPAAAVGYGPNSTFWSDQAYVEDVADSLPQLAGAAFAHVRVDASTRSVTVSLYRASDQVLDSIRDRFGPSVKVTAAANSLAEIKSAWSTIKQAAAQWYARGVDLRHIVDSAEGYLEVGVASDTSIAQAQFDAQFGSGLVRVVPDHIKLLPTTYRKDDVSPWNGGGLNYWLDKSNPAIDLGQRCTAGIPVADASGNRYMLTAAHCYTQGDVIHNGYIKCRIWGLNDCQRWDTYGSKTIIGQCCHQISCWCSGGHDVETIPTNMSRLDFIGAWDEPYTDIQDYTVANFDGAVVCQSGGFSGERCGLVEQGTPQTRCRPGQCLDDVVKVKRNDGNWVGGTGDSGGPVYSYDTSTSYLHPRGSWDAVDENSLVDCPAGTLNPNDRLCGTIGFFIDLPSVLQMWNLHVVKT